MSIQTSRTTLLLDELNSMQNSMSTTQQKLSNDPAALLDELFSVLYSNDQQQQQQQKRGTNQQNQQVPMRLRRLPKSFFMPPPLSSSSSTSYANYANCGNTSMAQMTTTTGAKCQIKPMPTVEHTSSASHRHFGYHCCSQPNGTILPMALTTEQSVAASNAPIVLNSSSSSGSSSNHNSRRAAISFIEGAGHHHHHHYSDATTATGTAAATAARMYASIEVTATTLKYQKTLQLPAHTPTNGEQMIPPTATGVRLKSHLPTPTMPHHFGMIAPSSVVNSSPPPTMVCHQQSKEALPGSWDYSTQQHQSACQNGVWCGSDYIFDSNNVLTSNDQPRSTTTTSSSNGSESESEQLAEDKPNSGSDYLDLDGIDSGIAEFAVALHTSSQETDQYNAHSTALLEGPNFSEQLMPFIAAAAACHHHPNSSSSNLLMEAAFGYQNNRNKPTAAAAAATAEVVLGLQSSSSSSSNVKDCQTLPLGSHSFHSEADNGGGPTTGVAPYTERSTMNTVVVPTMHQQQQPLTSAHVATNTSTVMAGYHNHLWTANTTTKWN